MEQIIYNNGISLKAKAMYLLIKGVQANNGTVSKNELRQYLKEGERSFHSTWNELKEAGYLNVEKIHDNVTGHFVYEITLNNIASSKKI